MFGLTMGGTTAFYTYTTYMPAFLTNTVHLTRDQATQISFITLVLYALLQPVAGAISDRIGRRPVLLWFGVLGTLCTVPILTALSGTHDYTTALLLMLAALVIVSGYTSINAVVKAELFPAAVRALGVGLPYALAVSIFGGTAPYVALWFKEPGHRGGVLLVCHRADLRLAAGVCAHGRHQAHLAHRPRLNRGRCRPGSRVKEAKARAPPWTRQGAVALLPSPNCPASEAQRHAMLCHPGLACRCKSPKILEIGGSGRL